MMIHNGVNCVNKPRRMGKNVMEWDECDANNSVQWLLMIRVLVHKSMTQKNKEQKNERCERWMNRYSRFVRHVVNTD